MKIIRIENSLVAYIKDKLYTKNIENKDNIVEVYEQLLNSNEEDILKYFKAEPTSVEKQLEIDFEKAKEESVKEYDKVKDILELMVEIRDHGHKLFEVNDNSIYLKGINISMPSLLVKEMLEACEEFDAERLYALINFWSLCAMNPDPRARHDLFNFVEANGLTITSSGNLLTYRRAWLQKSKNLEASTFISQQYLKYKRWKKNPGNYIVVKTEHGYISQPLDKDIPKDMLEVIGNLSDLYDNINEEYNTSFTDNHTKTFKIEIGLPMSTHRDDVDPDPTVPCSKGLHTGSPEYVNRNKWLGDTVLACLVNPRNVTAVPEHDHHKMRSCEILPISIAETDSNGTIIEPDYKVFDLELSEHTKEELEFINSLDSTELEEYKKYQYVAPELDFDSLATIQDKIECTIEQANDIVKNRVY